MPSYLTSYESEMTMFDEPILPQDDLNHSVLLDVHTHSDYPEVNTFIDEIYSAHFAGAFTAVKREHSKVVLLHLYVVWTEDPRLYTALAFNKNEYEAGSRYNALHISSRIINIIKQMKRLGLIELHLGFKDRRPGGRGRVTRIRHLEPLVSHFQEAVFSTFEINTLTHPIKQCRPWVITWPTFGPVRRHKILYHDSKQR